MKVIFLDIDGVLNAHVNHSNGYCGLCAQCVSSFNRILEATDAQIIVHSAWRYSVLQGYMTLDGLAILLASHGVKVHTGISSHRILGVTQYDTGQGSEEDRTNQILEEVDARGLTSWVAIDDMELDLREDLFVRTGRLKGLTESQATRIIALLNKEATS